MNKIRNHITGGFTQVPNKLIEEENLTANSRFLYVLLASKKDDWNFFSSQLSKTMKMHKETFRKYRDELCANGWIYVENQIISNGKFEGRIYHIFPSPINPEKFNISNYSDQPKEPNNPSTKNTATEEYGDGKSPAHNNTNIKQDLKKNKNKNIFIKKTKKSTSQNPNPRQ